MARYARGVGYLRMLVEVASVTKSTGFARELILAKMVSIVTKTIRGVAYPGLRNSKEKYRGSSLFILISCWWALCISLVA